MSSVALSAGPIHLGMDTSMDKIAGAVVGVVRIGIGVATVARPALLTHLFGSTGYATLSGRLAVA